MKTEANQDAPLPLTKQEKAEMRKIDRLAMMHKATRNQLMRGMNLHRKHNAFFLSATE